MKGSRKSEEGKCRDEHVALREVCRVAEANQLRLQHLELAIVNLTNICNAIRKDICSLGFKERKAHGEGNDTRPPSSRLNSPSLEMNKGNNMLAVQMQQLVQQAAALGILKDPNNSGDTKPNGEAQRNEQATAKTKNRSTRSLNQTTESTTKKKMSMKLATVNNMGATQPKVPQKISTKTAPTTKVSLKSTVKKTKTTISKVYADSTAKRGKEATKGGISAKSSVKNVETAKGNGTTKFTIRGNQGHNNSQSATKSSALIMLCTSGAPIKSDMKARRKWSSTKEVTMRK